MTTDDNGFLYQSLIGKVNIANKSVRDIITKPVSIPYRKGKLVQKQKFMSIVIKVSIPYRKGKLGFDSSTILDFDLYQSLIGKVNAVLVLYKESLVTEYQSLIGKVNRRRNDSHKGWIRHVSIPYRKGKQILAPANEFIKLNVSIPYRKGKRLYSQTQNISPNQITPKSSSKVGRPPQIKYHKKCQKSTFLLLNKKHQFD